MNNELSQLQREIRLWNLAYTVCMLDILSARERLKLWGAVNENDTEMDDRKSDAAQSVVQDVGR